MTPSLADLRLRWRDLPRCDYEWAWYVSSDADGYVRLRTLLSGSVSTWASQIWHEDEQRVHDWTEQRREMRGA